MGRELEAISRYGALQSRALGSIDPNCRHPCCDCTIPPRRGMWMRPDGLLANPAATAMRADASNQEPCAAKLQSPPSTSSDA